MTPEIELPYPDEQPADFSWLRVLTGLILGAVILYAAAQVALPVAGVVYVIAYFGIAWQAPAVALLLVFAMAPFPYDVSPGMVRFSMAELNLLICSIVLGLQYLQGLRPLRLGPLFKPCLFYIAVCIVAGFIHPQGNETVKTIVQMCVYFFAAVAVFASLVDHKRELLPALYALLAVGCFQAVLTIMGKTYSIGIHKNAAGASLAGIFVVAFELWFGAVRRRERLVVTGVLLLVGAGLLMSLSRGAWVGAGCGCAIIVLMRRQYAMLMKLTLVATPVVVFCWMQLPEQAREYAFDFEARGHNSIAHRYINADRFLEYYRASPIIGSGTGVRKLVDATNVVLSTLAETGIIGLVAFAAIFVQFLRMVWWAQRRVSRVDPLYSLLAVGAGMMLARLAHGMFDHYWSRGALTVAWCAAGMATLAYLTIKAREEDELYAEALAAEDDGDEIIADAGDELLGLEGGDQAEASQA